MATSRKKKTKYRVHKGRLIAALLILIVVAGGLIFGISKAAGGHSQKMSPIGPKFVAAAEEVKAKSWNLLLVNPWNAIPEGYTVNTKEVTEMVNEQSFVDERIYDDLMAMMHDCQAAGHDPLIYSAYREHETQCKYFEDEIVMFSGEGVSEQEAYDKAAALVAVPGTSEHECGLALDIVDLQIPYHNDDQENTDTTQWFHEHCWEYGFIMRYPKGKEDITGIEYEPWHYRYVGKEAAKEMHESGQTLEEYLGKAEHGEKVKYEGK